MGCLWLVWSQVLEKSKHIQTISFFFFSFYTILELEKLHPARCGGCLGALLGAALGLASLAGRSELFGFSIRLMGTKRPVSSAVSTDGNQMIGKSEAVASVSQQLLTQGWIVLQ